MQFNQSAICAGVRAGDVRSEEELLACIKQISWYRLVGSISFGYGVEDADDCLQDVYAIVLQAIRNGDPREPERLVGYIHTVVRRKIAAHIKRQIRSHKIISLMDGTEEIFAFTAGNQEDDILREECASILERALAQLKSSDREILTRFYLQEQKPARICLEMRLSPDQFRLLKSRAKAKLGAIGKELADGKSRKLRVKVAA